MLEPDKLQYNMIKNFGKITLVSEFLLKPMNKMVKL